VSEWVTILSLIIFGVMGTASLITAGLEDGSRALAAFVRGTLQIFMVVANALALAGLW